jgi:hypothetical protein
VGGHERPPELRVDMPEMRDRLIRVEERLSAHIEVTEDQNDKIQTQVEWAVERINSWSREWDDWMKRRRRVVLIVGALVGQLAVWIGEALFQWLKAQWGF